MSISCLVCLENFEPTAEVVSINRCGHVFHAHCLNEWRSSKQSLSNTCPLCRVTYNKRSLTKLFLGVAESEKDFKKDLQKLEEEKNREKYEKQEYMNELSRVKTELGIKCQAYHIIDSFNNEYLQNNQKLKEQNEKLQAESNQIKEQMEALKKKLQPPPLVDLTGIEISDDEDIQFVSVTKIQKVIEAVVEINDDDDDDEDVQIIAAPFSSKAVSPICDNDQGHRIRPIETADFEDQSSVIPTKDEEEGHSSHVILEKSQIEPNYEIIVKTEMQEVQSIEVTPDISHLTFGDIPRQTDPQMTLPDFEEPVFKKHKANNNEKEFAYLHEYFLSQI